MRAAVPAAPGTLEYDPDDEALLLGTGRISPVPAGAWEFRVGGVRMLELWFERRASSDEADGLEAIRPRGWPQEWTSELLELITVLALLTELRPRQQALTDGPQLTAGDLRAAGVLPVAAPPAARVGARPSGGGAGRAVRAAVTAWAHARYRSNESSTRCSARSKTPSRSIGPGSSANPAAIRGYLPVAIWLIR